MSMSYQYRRFKFRVFDCQNKKYRSGTPGLGLDNDDITTSLYTNYEEIIEQSTGVLDKNKKVIFDGDIVLYKKTRYAVIWNDLSCSFELYSEENKTTVRFPKFESQKLTIIGNKHFDSY